VEVESEKGEVGGWKVRGAKGDVMDKVRTIKVFVFHLAHSCC
jgi:hypothetical protein